MLISHIKMLINDSVSGAVNDDIDFSYGSELLFDRGCGVTLRDQFWYFGGYKYKRQVSFKVIISNANKLFLRLVKLSDVKC